MAKQYEGIDITLTASGDLNSKQFYFVQPAQTARKVEAATGGSRPAPIGVLQNDPNDGEAAQVRIFGSTRVYANATTAIGYRDWISSASDGQAIIAAASAAVGIALEALSSGSGTLIEVLLYPPTHPYSIDDNTP